MGLRETMTIHAIKAPSGHWVLVGSVPARLALVTNDGREATDKDYENAVLVGPRIARMTERGYVTREAAEAAVRGWKEG